MAVPLPIHDPCAGAQARCERSRLACPVGLRCVCRPCTKDLHVEVFPAPVVLGLCCFLLSAALLLSFGWRSGIELAQAARRSARRVRKWLGRLEQRWRGPWGRPGPPLG